MLEIKKKYYYGNKLYSETPYLDGKIHGVEKIYYENGKLEREIPYSSKTYWENGVAKKEEKKQNKGMSL